MWGYGPVEEIRTLPKEQLVGLVQKRRFRTPRCLAAFIDRCQLEVFKGAKAALTICLEGPEYVDRVFQSGEPHHADSLIRAYGTLATCLSLTGSDRLAEQTFRSAREVEPEDPLEKAALETRYAYHRAKFDWREGFNLADSAVEDFRTDQGEIREDRCLARALIHRGIIQDYAFSLGEKGAEPEAACLDFREALGEAVNLPRNQLTAVHGLARTAVNMWLGGIPVRSANPASVIRDIMEVRKTLRKQRVPRKSPVDSKCRWLLGLAGYKLAGGLSEQAERYLRNAREDLIAVGSPRDVVELTLDYQWCLVQDGRIRDAYTECKFFEDRIPVAWQLGLHLWTENLKRGRLEESVVRSVFKSVKGVQKLVLPVDPRKKTAAMVGW